MRLGILQCADGKEIGLQDGESEPPLKHLVSTCSTFQSSLMLDPPSQVNVDARRAAYILSSPSPATKAIVDMSPYELVTWYTSKLERISFYVSKDGTTVLGIRVQFIRRLWEPKHYAGHRDKDEKDDEIEWPENQMTHLDVCGTEGERVVKIAASPATNPKALQVRYLTDQV